MIETRTDSPIVRRPFGIIHQDVDRQVARLRIGHSAYECDLAGHILFSASICGVRQGSEGVRGPDDCGLPKTHRLGRPGR